MAFPWRANGGSTLNAGLVALWFYMGSGPVLLGNPIFFVIFQGGPDLLSPPLDPRMAYTDIIAVILEKIYQTTKIIHMVP